MAQTLLRKIKSKTNLHLNNNICDFCTENCPETNDHLFLCPSRQKTFQSLPISILTSINKDLEPHNQLHLSIFSSKFQFNPTLQDTLSRLPNASLLALYNFNSTIANTPIVSGHREFFDAIHPDAAHLVTRSLRLSIVSSRISSRPVASAGR